MRPPKISILLPSLNVRPFLPERIESIVDQTFPDWEAIVLDSYSTDGTWEFFQSVGGHDPRFRLHQIPREGLYAALNRGIEMATGEFLHIATCDDTMDRRFLARLLEAFELCSQAGIAACDVMLINERGDPLKKEDMAAYLPAESIDDMLALETIRSYPMESGINYRPPPHDSLLHFSGKSVYLSLTQLLIRTPIAAANGPFDITMGPSSDLGWVARLTNLTGTVHIPEKLARWRFHGDQLSVKKDDTGLFRLEKMLERAGAELNERHPGLLTGNDRAALLLPCKRYLALSRSEIRRCWVETTLRSLWMLVERPFSTVLAMLATGYRPGQVRRSLLPMFMRRLRLSPQKIARPAVPLQNRPVLEART